MNQIHVHFRESDGEIWGWETGAPTSRPGLATATIDVADGCHCIPDPKLHKIDIATHEVVDKTPEEIALANLPTLIEVQGRVARALVASDQYMMPDRPLTDEVRAAWITYRQALRDLSKQPTPSEMVAVWPMLPDGADPVSDLRSRILQ